MHDANWTHSGLNAATSLIDCDLNQALSKFNECFEHGGECKKKIIFIGHENNIYRAWEKSLVWPSMQGK